MKIAFVGVKRKYQGLPESYRDHFNRFHLELPYYYARDGKNAVIISTVDYRDDGRPLNGGFLRCVPEDELRRSQDKFDVVIHWRKWFPWLYRPEAKNYLNCQDHSFSGEWVASVNNALETEKLKGVLCFPFWHMKNLQQELGCDSTDLVPNLTLGVDTDIYSPSPTKDFRKMLWSSDPGRGLMQAVELAVKLHKKDQRFQLHVCYPDYVPPQQKINHPAIVWHGNVQNGPALWKLFNECGTLPYTSCFREPSSRAHRQAQAAGSLVLYPPNMGTPSDLIQKLGGGIVAPIGEWEKIIPELIDNGTAESLGKKAREIAVSQNWLAQAQGFNQFMSED